MPRRILLERIDYMATVLSTTATQTVAQNQNVIFTENVTCNKGCNVMHRAGSGIITLRGSNSCCNPARYKVEFTGNIALATGATVGPISIALALAGEPLYGATATVTPAAVGDFFNVSVQTVITVPCNCCVTVAVENATVATTATPIDVANATTTITREC